MTKLIGVVTSPFDLKSNDKNRLENLFDLKFKFFNQNKKKDNKNLFKFLHNCSGIIAGTENYEDNLLKKLKKLEVIFRLGIGIDNIDHNYVNKNCIKIYNTPDAPSNSAAEYAVALIFDVIKGCTFSSNKTKKKYG